MDYPEKSNKPFFLKQTAEKVLKALHIAFAALTLGGLWSILLLLMMKRLQNADDFMIDWGVFNIFNYLVYYAFLGNLLTGLIYSLFTHWGLLKFNWIIAKWLGFLLLFAILSIWFQPAVNGMVALSDSGQFPGEARAAYFGYMHTGYLSVSLMIVMLVLLIFVSTLKPWNKRKEDFIGNIIWARRVIIPLTLFAAIMGIYQTYQLNKLRTMPVNFIDLKNSEDGKYIGIFEGGGGPYSATVVIRDHHIVQVALASERRSKYIDYAKGIVPRILEAQSPSVDAITGATTTSKCMMKAVEDALNQPGVVSPPRF